MHEFRQLIRHPDACRLYDYWDARRAGRRFPSRQDIDPLDLKFAVGNLILVDVLRDPLQFRYRLIGTQIIQRMGWDLTGKTVDDIPDPAYRQETFDAYRAVVESGEPNHSHHERLIRGQPRRFEQLRLPLADDGETINMLLSASLYFEPLPQRSPLAGPLPNTAGAPRRLVDG